MIFKRKFLMLMLLIFMIFAVGHVSATDNVTDGAEDVLGADETVSDDLSHDMAEDTLCEDISTDEVGRNLESDNYLTQEIQKNNLTISKSKNNAVKKYSAVKLTPKTRQYSTRCIKSTFKVWDCYDYGDHIYKKPASKIVKLKVFTGKKSKIYKGFTNKKSKVTFKIPKLAIGKHKIQVYYDGKLKKTSYIKVIKSKARVKASAITTTAKKSKYFRVVVKDHYYNTVRYTKIKLVINGKTHIVRTNKWGVARFNTKYLPVGKYKVLIKSSSKKFKINKHSHITVKKKTNLKRIILYPEDDQWDYEEVYGGDCINLMYTDHNGQFSKGISVFATHGVGWVEPHHIKIVKVKTVYKNYYTSKFFSRTAYIDYKLFRTNYYEDAYAYEVLVWYKIVK